MPGKRRQFTEAEDALLRRLVAGEVNILHVKQTLSTSGHTIDLRLETLGLTRLKRGHGGPRPGSGFKTERREDHVRDISDLSPIWDDQKITTQKGLSDDPLLDKLYEVHRSPRNEVYEGLR